MLVRVNSVFVLFCVYVAALRRLISRPRSPSDCVWIKKLKKRPKSTRAVEPYIDR
jgi:hypothetical protein